MNINLTLFAVAGAFFFFILFTAKFVWPPLMKAIEDRQKKIADGLAAAEEGKRALVEAERVGESSLKEARDRVQVMLADSERRANQIVDEAKTVAKTEADRILASAQERADAMWWGEIRLTPTARCAFRSKNLRARRRRTRVRP